MACYDMSDCTKILAVTIHWSECMHDKYISTGRLNSFQLTPKPLLESICCIAVSQFKDDRFCGAILGVL
jgi:hypothetical protein